MRQLRLICQASSRFSALAVTLESLNLYVPELYNTAAVLQRERAFGIGVVLDVNGDRAIQRDQQSRAFSPDLVGVPLPTGVDLRRWRCKVDDAARAVGLVLSLVVDVDFITRVCANRVPICTPNEHPAVGWVIDPELEGQDEVGIGVLADQMAVSTGRLHGTVDQTPVRVS